MNNTPSPREVSIAFYQMMARHTDLSQVCLALISSKEAMSNIISSFIRIPRRSHSDTSWSELLVNVYLFLEFTINHGKSPYR